MWAECAVCDPCIGHSCSAAGSTIATPNQSAQRQTKGRNQSRVRTALEKRVTRPNPAPDSKNELDSQLLGSRTFPLKAAAASDLPVRQDQGALGALLVMAAECHAQIRPANACAHLHQPLVGGSVLALDAQRDPPCAAPAGEVAQ